VCPAAAVADQIAWPLWYSVIAQRHRWPGSVPVADRKPLKSRGRAPWVWRARSPTQELASGAT
jgi:hypothetical protein